MVAPVRWVRANMLRFFFPWFSFADKQLHGEKGFYDGIHVFSGAHCS